MELAGQQLSLADVKSDSYVVGAVNDHIVPWPASYQATRLLGGDVRYVLSSGGHVAGIVNPPGPKAWHEIADSYPADARDWRAAAVRQAGSWWEDWADLVRTSSRAPRPAAADGQRELPAAGRCAGRLRARLAIASRRLTRRAFASYTEHDNRIMVWPASKVLGG